MLEKPADGAYVGGMDIVDAVTAVFFANGVTLAGIYAWWRVKQNDKDWAAIGICLAVAVVIGLFGLATQA